MKIAKFFAGIFGALGTVLLVGSIGLCLFSLNAPVRMEEIPEGAAACSETFAQAVSGKDFAEMQACIYGQPELGLSGEPADELSRLVWDVVQLNLEFSWNGECYMEDTVFCRDASVSYLDVSGMMANLQGRAHTLLTQRVEAATDMDELYDETGEFRQDLVDQVLKAAMTQCIMEDARRVTADVTVQLVNRDGRWWIIPDGALVTALSGGLE